MFVGNQRAEGIVEYDDHRTFRSRTWQEAEAAAQCGTRERQHHENDDQCTQSQQKPLFELQFADFTALQFLQKGEGAEINDAGFAQIQQMQNDGNCRSSKCDQNEGIKKSHRRTRQSPVNSERS